jgi:hypothetical protein
MTKTIESQIIFYSGPDGTSKIDVIMQDHTCWMSQKRIAEVFGVDVRTINEHIKEIYKSQELQEFRTIRKFRIVQKEGSRDVARDIDCYNLDMIISVGYRVSSIKATRFRIWATRTLNEFVTKGFVLDDQRLKQGTVFGKDYFDELLERIREIRASERRFYQKITDIYSQCSVDYNKDDPLTKLFYQTVQNKLHWAITGQTAAELIADRASADLPNMGLTNWKNAPAGKILKTDVAIAKNYLSESELRGLNRVVAMYLDYAENQAERGIVMTMKDWVSKLDSFLQFNEYKTLNHAGKISNEVAKKLAEKHFDEFRVLQDANFVSDFDEVVANMIPNKGDNKSKKK